MFIQGSTAENGVYVMSVSPQFFEPFVPGSPVAPSGSIFLIMICLRVGDRSRG